MDDIIQEIKQYIDRTIDSVKNSCARNGLLGSGKYCLELSSALLNTFEKILRKEIDKKIRASRVSGRNKTLKEIIPNIKNHFCPTVSQLFIENLDSNIGNENENVKKGLNFNRAINVLKEEIIEKKQIEIMEIVQNKNEKGRMRWQVYASIVTSIIAICISIISLSYDDFWCMTRRTRRRILLTVR
jgi:hypothetical protein